MEHGDVEKLISEEGNEVLRRLLRGYFDLRATREARREEVRGSDGVVRSRCREGCQRTLMSMFGEVDRCRICLADSSSATDAGLEGAWSASPVAWTTQYLDNLFAYNWVQTKSPAGAIEWVPDNEGAVNIVPDAFDTTKRHAPIMVTTDLSLKFDPSYRKIAKRFQENSNEFELAFAKAWFKLTHRDIGPRALHRRWGARRGTALAGSRPRSRS